MWTLDKLYFFKLLIILFCLLKLFMKLFVTNFVRLDPEQHLKSCWIRIRIEMNSE